MPKIILHIILAFVVLMNTMGIAVNKHFCQKQLKAVAVFITPNNCHDLVNTPHCTANEEQEVKICCANNQAFKGDDPLKSCCSQTQQNGDDICTSEHSDSNNCCHNETEWLKSHLDLVFSIIYNDIRPVYTFTILPSLYPIVKKDESVSFTSHQQIPLLSLQRNIPIWLQTFLC